MQFVPSIHGWRFTNDFTPGPLLSLRLPILNLAWGDCDYGLCGGMVWAALDFYKANMAIPDIREQPAVDSAVYNYLIARQRNSLFPFEFLRYCCWLLSQRGAIREFGKIAQEVTTGPVTVGLAYRKSFNPFKLFLMHQVLVTGGDSHELTIYDPNYPDDDTVCLRRVGERLEHSGDGPIAAAFRTTYRQKSVAGVIL